MEYNKNVIIADITHTHYFYYMSASSQLFTLHTRLLGFGKRKKPTNKQTTEQRMAEKQFKVKMHMHMNMNMNVNTNALQYILSDRNQRVKKIRHEIDINEGKCVECVHCIG